MKWNKYTIETTTAAEDYLSSALMDLGIEGVQIEDNVPLTKEDQAEMFIVFCRNFHRMRGSAMSVFIWKTTDRMTLNC